MKNIKNYQEKQRFIQKDKNFIYPILGLVGEAGEVAEKIKKILRDKNKIIDENTKKEIAKEMGDVLWYFG